MAERAEASTIYDLLESTQRVWHVSELTQFYGWTRDEVRAEVRRERHEGHIICSGEAGYWIPQSRAEVESFVKNMEQRIAGIAISVKSARELLKNEADAV